MCKWLEVIIAITIIYCPGQSGAWFWKPVASGWISVHCVCCGGCVLMIYSGLPAFWTVVCTETLGPVIALFSRMLMYSSYSYFSSSSLSTVVFISLWSLVQMVLVVMVLWLVWRLLLVGSLVFGLVRGWGHRCELPGNYPVFAVVMVIYTSVRRIMHYYLTPHFF